MFFASITSSPTFAIVWMTLFLIIILALAGFLTSDMPVFYEWIEDSNVLRFAMLGLIKNEFSGQESKDESGGKVDGIDAIPSSLKPDTDLSVGAYIGILVAFLAGARILIYIALLLDDTSSFPDIFSKDASTEYRTAAQPTSEGHVNMVEARKAGHVVDPQKIEMGTEL